MFCPATSIVGFPGGSAGREAACNVGDLGSIPGLGQFPEEGNGYPLQYSGLENSMDCIVHGVTKSGHNWATFTFHFFTGVFYLFICFKRIGNYFMKQFYVDCLKFLSDNFNSWITSVLLSVGSLFSNKLWFSWSLVWPVIFTCVLDIFNSMLGNSWPFKNLSSRQLPSLALACGFCWLFRLSRHPHCGRPGPVLLITVRCGKSHFSHPTPPVLLQVCSSWLQGCLAFSVACMEDKSGRIVLDHIFRYDVDWC